MESVETTLEEERGAGFWIAVVGVLSVCLVIFLVRIDNQLTYSDREVKLRDRMEEVRGAQASLPSRVTDERLLLSAESK